MLAAGDSALGRSCAGADSCLEASIRADVGDAWQVCLLQGSRMPVRGDARVAGGFGERPSTLVGGTRSAVRWRLLRDGHVTSTLFGWDASRAMCCTQVERTVRLRCAKANKAGQRGVTSQAAQPMRNQKRSERRLLWKPNGHLGRPDFGRKRRCVDVAGSTRAGVCDEVGR